ncbi:MAG: Cobalamin adenosyltransferase [Firmicutes bacterium ADurb.Bin182]|nr:MAG: Cobalamin adenosyltransferase [Firmicutes bacterium ADurb.Bin182]
MKVLTEEELRGALLGDGDVYRIDSGTYITQQAKNYAKEHRITIDARETPEPSVSGRCGSAYVDDATGKRYSQKPEDMTHIRANRLVKKSDPRIAFRGKLDTLEAFIVRLAVLAKSAACMDLYRDLGELLNYTRNILAAEVKQQEFSDIMLMGMDADALRARSHSRDGLLNAHPVPCAEQGLIASELNLLRAQVREAELSAAAALPSRLDIIRALNRLSSAVYILYCRAVAGYK